MKHESLIEVREGNVVTTHLVSPYICCGIDCRPTESNIATIGCLALATVIVVGAGSYLIYHELS
jgi:hypothetical protein